MLKKIGLLCLCISIITKPICVDPLPGENLWRLVARIGTCLNTFSAEALSDLDILLSVTDDIDKDLLSISDVLCSKIMAIDAGNDAQLLSVVDTLISVIESTTSVIESLIVSTSDTLVSVIESTSSTTDELILSVSDALTSKIMAIDAGNDALLLSVSDALTQDIQQVDTDLLSVSDVLTSKIMAIDAGNDALLLSVSDALTQDIQDVDEDLLSVSDILCSKIMMIEFKLDILTASALEELVDISEKLSSICDKVLQTMVLIDSFADEIENTLSNIDAAIDEAREDIIAVVVSVSDELTEDISNVNTNLLSVSDFLTSKIMAIDAGNDTLILSVSDNLVSIIESTSAETNNLILSISDALSNQIMDACGGSCIDSTELLLSIGDALTDDIQQVETDLLSLADVLSDLIINTCGGSCADSDTALLLSISDALTEDIQQVDTDLLSVSDVLSSKIMALDGAVSAIDATVTTINNTVNIIDENLLSIADELSDLIINTCGGSCGDNDSALLLSISDALTEDINNLDLDLLSVSDVLGSKIMAITDGECSTLINFANCCDALRSDYISFNFNYGVLQDQTTTTIINVASVTETPGMITATAGGPLFPPVDSITLTSNRTVPCSTGDEVYAICSALFTSSLPETFLIGTYAYIGLFDANNGMGVGFNTLIFGTSTFGLMYRNNGTTTFVPRTSFNVDLLNGAGPSGFTLNTAALNVFRFSYIWYGANIARYQVLGNNGEWITFHEIANINNQTDAAFSNQDLPMRIEISTSATGFTPTQSISTSSWRAGVIHCGENNAGTRTFSAQRNVALAALAPETYLFTIRNKTTFGGEVNRVLARLSHVGGGNGETNTAPVLLRYYKNETLTGAAFTDVNANNSIMEYDQSATVFTGGNLLWVVGADGLEFEYTPAGAMEFYIAPGESVTVTAQQLGGVAVAAAYATSTWEELQ